MRAAKIFLTLLSTAVPSALNSQLIGEWDVNCPLFLAPRFSAPFVTGVQYGGYTFETEWRSINQTPPLPSRNWYEPLSDPNPWSTDGRARWYGAEVEGHCTVERTEYYVSLHVYPVAYRGTVRTCWNGGGSGGGGGGPWFYITDPTDPAYDPYGDGGSYDAACSDATADGNGGSAGLTTCHDEYVYVELSDDGGVTWYVWWEGWATVCG